MSRKTTLRGPDGLRIEFDADQIFKDDPGQGTPVLVVLGNATASFNCASCEGELDCGEVQLSIEQTDWLQSDSVVAQVDLWMAKHGA